MLEFDAILTHIDGHTLLARDRLFAVYNFSRHASLLEGDMAEVGVYKGGTSVLLARANPAKTVHSFDTFTGIPSAREADDVHVNGDFDLGGTVPPILAAEPNVRVHVGTFPATAPPDPDGGGGGGDSGGGGGGVVARPRRYCFAHYDGDTYQSCLDFIAHFRPRTVPGGILMFDDYGWRMCPGVERALREAFGSRRVIQSANYQAAVIC